MERVPRSLWLDTALAFQKRALDINHKTVDKYYSIFSQTGIGRVCFLKKDFRQSINWYSKAYENAKSMNAVDLQSEIAKYLSESYMRLKDYRNGMNWYVIYSGHKDSLFNEEKTQDVTRTQMKYEFEKQEVKAKAAQERKDALTAAELEKEKKMRNLFVGGFIFVFLFAGVFFYQRNHIRRERNRSEALLLNILPSEIASELKRTGGAKAKSYSEVTVLFADFVDFTRMSEKVSAPDLVDEIHFCFSAPNEEMIKEHARMGGFPANVITPINSIIDPTTAE